MDDSVEKFALKMWRIVGKVSLLIFSVIWRGWLFSIIWGWFAVPIFGLPILSVSQSAGIMTVVAFVTPINMPTQEEIEKKRTMPVRVAFLMFTSSAILGVAWCIHTWMTW